METDIVKNIIMAVLFFVFLGMIVIGQKTVGLGDLGLEITGPVGLFVELYAYNRKYKQEGGSKMTDLLLKHIDKIYDNDVQAAFDFNLEVKDKEFIVFVGPSEYGKSTTPRMITGLEDIPAEGFYIDDKLMNNVGLKDRDIAMISQPYVLYPYISAYDDMALGLKLRKTLKEEIDKRVWEVARTLEIEDYLDHRPKALSGGQCQCVALGRVIVCNVRVFLMDGPLSNLDTKLRAQMKDEVIRLYERISVTTIYVTHDQTEAVTMADRIIVMKVGYI